MLVLTDSNLLLFVGKGKNITDEPLRLQQFSYLDEISGVQEVGAHRYKFAFTTEEERVR